MLILRRILKNSRLQAKELPCDSGAAEVTDLWVKRIL